MLLYHLNTYVAGVSSSPITHVTSTENSFCHATALQHQLPELKAVLDKFSNTIDPVLGKLWMDFEHDFSELMVLGYIPECVEYH